MTKTWDIITTVTIVGSGILAGVFFAFSTFVTSGLKRLPAREGTAAMQSINVTAQHPPLMIALFGTAVLAVALIVRALRTWSDRGSLLLLLGAVVYIVGAVLVTAAVNVPLNNHLAGLDATAATTPAEWARFLHSWLIANHVRTAMCIASTALLVAAVMRRPVA